MRCGNVHQDNISKHRKWFRSAKMIPLSRLLSYFARKKNTGEWVPRSRHEIDNFVSNHPYNKDVQ